MHIVCPKCQETEIGTVELVTGVAGVSAFTSTFELEYDGTGTKVDWNGQVTITNAIGNPLLHCESCDHEWFEGALILQINVWPVPANPDEVLSIALDQALSNLRAIQSLTDDPHAIEIIEATAVLLDAQLQRSRDGQQTTGALESTSAAVGGG